MKVVINSCYGGFSLSDAGIARYTELKGAELPNDFYDRDIPRDDPILIKVIQELKEDADGFAAQLKILDIPDDVEWQIEEYDGNEWVAERHRTWS